MKAIVFGVALFALGAASATAAVPGNSASVVASTYKAGSPVALTFNLSYPMQCGNPGETLVVRLPAGMKVPASIGAAAVRVNGGTARSVTTHGSTVAIGIAKKQWITCDLLGMGKLSVVIGARAGLANPAAKGVYGFQVAIGPVRGTPKLRIS